MQDSSSPYLFFYGSLKQAFSTQDQLAIRDSLRYIAEARIEGQLYDLGSYPAMIQGDGWVKGEIHQMMSPHVLDVLDEYEGYEPNFPQTSLYRRERFTFGERLAWVYLYQGTVLEKNRIWDGYWSPKNT